MYLNLWTGSQVQEGTDKPDVFSLHVTVLQVQTQIDEYKVLYAY